VSERRQYWSGYSSSLVSGGGGGSGDVVGPASSTIRAVTIFADATGKVIANSLLLTDAGGNLGLPAAGYLNFDTSSIGASGYGLRDNGGTIEVRNSGGAWSPIPSSVSSGANTAKSSFAFNTASPVTVAALATGDVVMIATVTITTPFNDAAATLEVGITGSTGAILSSSDIATGTAGAYQSVTPLEAGNAVNLLLTITPGTATAGAGYLTVLFHKI